MPKNVSLFKENKKQIIDARYIVKLQSTCIIESVSLYHFESYVLLNIFKEKVIESMNSVSLSALLKGNHKTFINTVIKAVRYYV